MLKQRLGLLKQRLGIIVFFVTVFHHVSVMAEEKQSNVQKFAEIVSGLRTFQAEFEQKVHDESGKVIDFSAGTLTLERPNHFRWEVKKAFPQIIVADGDHLWTYEVDLEQVTIQNQSVIVGSSPLLLLTSDEKDLEKSYDFALSRNKDNPENLLFILKPKLEESVFESVQVLVKNNKIVELLMSDSLGQSTSVKFTQVKMNKKIDVALFRLDIPKGVDVVDSRDSVTTE